ncbi:MULTISPECIES: TolC family protein [Dyella]|uniref:TolC family protein n=2 Tax=Dyella TaxID=231454 RepID=A0A4R0Z0L9_9GAMM|nr:MULTISPECIES: TolC family protein [Dyella]TBR39742.1 TolC family protein [Dyella terrae]TCI12676.1 TolC family protein [Dyella soli]
MSLLLHPPHTFLRRTAALCLGMGTLAGCATYHPLPLPDQASTAANVQALHGAADAHMPLGPDDVQRLVLLNNPDLRTRAARHAVARAQAARSKAIPNPVLGGSIGYLLSGVGDSTAWTASLSQDITALITLSPRRESADATADAVDAGLLWEAWQVSGKARLLTVDVIEETRQLTFQRTAVDALDRRAERLRQAIAAGQLDRASVAPDLLAAVDAHTALNDLQQRWLDHRQQLAALMGLSPDADLPLATDLRPQGVDAGHALERAGHIKDNRPDLVALQLGYRAQEANVRAAVLAQFPALSLGYDASQDNSRVRNGGPAITLELPLFDRHRNAVDEATATRQQLHDEYAARVASAQDEVRALVAAHRQAADQRDAQAQALDGDLAAARMARDAVDGGGIDIRTATDLEVAALSRQSALVALDQRLLEQEVALDLLLGRGMPTTLAMEDTSP